MIFTIFGLLLLVSFGVTMLLLRPRPEATAVARRLEIITTNPLPQDSDGNLLAPQGEATTGVAPQLTKYISRFRFSEDLRLLILHSGSSATAGSVVVGSLLGAVCLGAIAQTFFGLLPLDILAVAVGASSRWMMLKMQKSRRLEKFNVALPEAIDLMARALRAGHSMSSTIEIVAQQSAEPLASEFEIVFQQQKFGIPFRDALLQLGGRVPSKDLHFLVTAILVQKETGGDLTEILDRTTRIIRERIRIEGEIRTYTAQGRLTGWILSALPIFMLTLINMVTPGYSHILFHDPLGQKLLYAGGTLIVLGGLVIRKIVDIEV